MGQKFSCVSAGTVFFSAVFQEDIATLQAILKQQPRAVAFCDQDKATALHHAARLGYLDVVSTLWVTAQRQYGLERARRLILDATTTQRMTPLMFACQQGQGEVVEYLLLQGANPFCRDTKGNTTLHLAVKEGQVDTAARLLGTKQHRLMLPEDDILATHYIQFGQRKVRFVDVHNADGLAALHIAALESNTQMCQVLARQGADLSSRIRKPLQDPNLRSCVEGSTALHISAALNQERFIRYLLHVQNQIPNLDLRRVGNRAGLKPINCVIARGGQNMACATEIQFMLDDSLPESILQILYLPERAIVGGGDNYTPSDAFRRKILSITGVILQRIKLMLSCDKIASAASQPALSHEAESKDQILRFVQYISQKKLSGEDWSAVGEENNGKKYYAINNSSSTLSCSLQSDDFLSQYKTLNSDKFSVNLSQKLTSREFNSVVHEIDSTLQLVEEVKSMISIQKKRGEQRRRWRRQDQNQGGELRSYNIYDDDDDDTEGGAPWRGALASIAGVIKPSMLAELFQAARFLISNIASAPAQYGEGDSSVSVRKILSTCCVLKWSLNSAKQHQLQNLELQQFQNTSRKEESKESQRSAQARNFREAIRQQSVRAMSPEVVTKLMEVIKRRNSNGNSSVVLRPHHSPSLSASLSDTQDGQIQKLDIIREDSREAQISQQLVTQVSEPVMSSSSRPASEQLPQQLVTQISEPVLPASLSQGEASDQLGSQFAFDVQATNGIFSHQLYLDSQFSSSPELMDSPRPDSLSSHPITPTLDQQNEDQLWVPIPNSFGSVGSSVGSVMWIPQSNQSDQRDTIEEVMRESWQSQALPQVIDQESVVSERAETVTASEFSSDKYGGARADVQIVEDLQVSVEATENWSSMGSSFPGDKAASEQLLTSHSISFHNIFSERQSSKGVPSSSGDGELCSICYERSPCVSIKTCNHEMCVECAFHLSHDGVGYPRCPFCRQRIRDFFKLSSTKPS